MPLHLPKFVESDRYIAKKAVRIGRIIAAGELLPSGVPLRLLRRLYEQRRIVPVPPGAVVEEGAAPSAAGVADEPAHIEQAPVVEVEQEDSPEKPEKAEVESVDVASKAKPKPGKPKK